MCSALRAFTESTQFFLFTVSKRGSWREKEKVLLFCIYGWQFLPMHSHRIYTDINQNEWHGIRIDVQRTFSIINLDFSLSSCQFTILLAFFYLKFLHYQWLQMIHVVFEMQIIIHSFWKLDDYLNSHLNEIDMGL